MKTTELANRLEAWATWISSGYEAPAASIAMLDAAEILKKLDFEISTNYKTVQLDIIDQDENVVGSTYIPIEDMNKLHGHVDQDETTWCPPTAWAYMQLCKAHNKERERRKMIERALAYCFKTGIDDWAFASSEVDTLYQEYIRGDLGNE